jgi:Holliday junction resolvasome RuvABC ATP-dependent DNA helicase subunit
MDAILQGFIDDHKARGVPPPHVLLVGRDDGRNASIAREFAGELGVDLYTVDSGSVNFTGDLTAMLTVKKVSLLSNIQKLKGAMRNALLHDLQTGEIRITIGGGPAARIHTMQLEVGAFIATCPSKHECPVPLLKEFRQIIPVEPYTSAELLGVPETEAAKNRISFD